MGEKKTITITKEDLIKGTAEVINSEHIDEFLKSNPVLILAFLMFSKELEKVLFNEESEG